MLYWMVCTQEPLLSFSICCPGQAHLATFTLQKQGAPTMVSKDNYCSFQLRDQQLVQCYLSLYHTRRRKKKVKYRNNTFKNIPWRPDLLRFTLERVWSRLQSLGAGKQLAIASHCNFSSDTGQDNTDTSAVFSLKNFLIYKTVTRQLSCKDLNI